jgi:glycosyltransferase involved in cell wall biosynthesis
MMSGRENQMADVGIVMPVYRQNLDHLRIALRSVLGQSYRNYRFVIVGDGAPEDVVRTLYEETAGDARVQIVLKPVNEGVAAALNLGFDMLMSDPAIEYLTWVSSDNFYYPYLYGNAKFATAGRAGLQLLQPDTREWRSGP